MLPVKMLVISAHQLLYMTYQDIYYVPAQYENLNHVSKGHSWHRLLCVCFVVYTKKTKSSWWLGVVAELQKQIMVNQYCFFLLAAVLANRSLTRAFTWHCISTSGHVHCLFTTFFSLQPPLNCILRLNETKATMFSSFKKTSWETACCDGL